MFSPFLFLFPIRKRASKPRGRKPCGDSTGRCGSLTPFVPGRNFFTENCLSHPACMKIIICLLSPKIPGKSSMPGTRFVGCTNGFNPCSKNSFVQACQFSKHHGSSKATTQFSKNWHLRFHRASQVLFDFCGKPFVGHSDPKTWCCRREQTISEHFFARVVTFAHAWSNILTFHMTIFFSRERSVLLPTIPASTVYYRSETV